jgi:GMP synthase (glutamine-hydrolysing)
MMRTRAPLLVLRTGDPVSAVAERRGSFFDLFRETVGDAWDGEWREVDLREDDVLHLPRCAAAIITGSAASVADRAPWTLRAEAWLRHAVLHGVPVLGVCYGHQMLAQALGGLVQRNPRGREMGTVTVTREPASDDDPLFAGFPRAFSVNMSHVDSAIVAPRGATILARTALEPHAAFRVRPLVYGVQYHPEFDADVMRGYVSARAETIRQEGLDPEALLAGAATCPWGAETLRRFVSLVAAR